MPSSIPLQDAWLGHTFGSSTYTKPTSWWVLLHYGEPGGYCAQNAWTAAGRKECTEWTEIEDSSISNATEIAWLNLPDPGSNDEVSWASVWDSSIGGTPLAYARLSEPITVGPGDELALAVGALTISNVLPVDLGDVTGSVTVSFAQSRVVKMRLTGDVDLSGGFTAPATADWRMLIVTQDGTGGWGVTWPELSGTEPVVSPDAGQATVVWLVWDGTSWHVMGT